MEIFTQRVRKLRKKKKMTLEGMGRKLGVAKSTFAGYESGNRQPGLEMLTDIAKVLETSTDYLVGLTNDPRPPGNLNAGLFFKEKSLHYNGIPLDSEELDAIHTLLTIIVKERLKNQKPEELAGQKQ